VGIEYKKNTPLGLYEGASTLILDIEYKIALKFYFYIMIINRTNITYRKAEVKDANVLAEYRVKFLNEIFNIDVHSETEQLRIELVDYFRQSLTNNSLIAWLAKYENKIISTSSLVIWQAPLSYSGLGKKGKRGYILNMFTLKEFRKNGIASVLLEKLLWEAKSLNLEFVHLHATDDGLGVYKKIGFKEPLYPELKLKID
jgi:GNAT superfamily N-acetyltransferase